MAKTWSRMNVSELKTVLQKHNLETTGFKADLVKRLAENYEANPAMFQRDSDNEEKTKEKTMPPEPSMFDEIEVGTETTKEAESMDIDTAEDEDLSKDSSKETPVKLENLTVEELQKELLKRKTVGELASLKTTSTDWVKFLDEESDQKLLKELNKLNKVQCFNNRTSEINSQLTAHRVHVFPIGFQDLADSVILDTMKICKVVDVKFVSVDPDQDPVGMLSLTFHKQSQMDKAAPVLSEFKPDIQVGHNTPDQTWREDWRKMTEQITMNQHDHMVFLPSLPKSITDDDMWDLFPKAKSIHLIDKETRKHAYVIFLNPEDVTVAVEALNARGPLNDNLKFCGMLRFKRMLELVTKRKSGVETGGVQAAGKASRPGSTIPGRTTPARTTPANTTPAKKNKKKKKKATATANNQQQQQQKKQNPNQKTNQKNQKNGFSAAGKRGPGQIPNKNKPGFNQLSNQKKSSIIAQERRQAPGAMNQTPARSLKRQFSPGDGSQKNKRARNQQSKQENINFGSRGRGRGSANSPGGWGAGGGRGGGHGGGGGRGGGRGIGGGRGAGREIDWQYGGVQAADQHRNTIGWRDYEEPVPQHNPMGGDRFDNSYGGPNTYDEQNAFDNRNSYDDFPSTSYQPPQPMYPENKLATAMETLSKLTSIRNMMQPPSLGPNQYDEGQRYGNNEDEIYGNRYSNYN